MDVSSQVKVQMLEHRLNGIQQKVDGLNPVFLLTMETRLEDLHGDLIELRNLYSSPSSSLNLVLDGLLKKVKDLEAGEAYYGKDRSGRKVHNGPSQSVGSRNTGGNDGLSYRQLTSNRMNGNIDKGPSALAGSGLMQLNAHRGSLN